MRCPYCGEAESKVIDSRNMSDGIRRRRECLRCRTRFTTQERLQLRNLFVVKKDNRREDFNRDKLLAGIGKACDRRPLPAGSIDKLVDNIESELYRQGKLEIPSSVIGDMVIERLEELDPIAHIRFASVYREFTDITALKQAVDTLMDSKGEMPPAAQLPLLSREQLTALGQRRRRQK